jgi:hypothetical protein
MKTTIISDTSTLAKLLTSNHARIQGKIKLNLAYLTPTEAKSYEQKINDNYHACGCEVGALITLLSVGTMLGYPQISGEPMNWNYAWKCIAIIFTLALIGKMIGLLLAKYRLRKTINRLVMMNGIPYARDINSPLSSHFNQP